MSKLKLKDRIAELEAKLGIVVEKDPTAADPWLGSRSYPGLFGMYASQSHTGVPVTWATSLAVAAVYSCVKCLSEDCAKIPLNLRRILPKGGSKIDTKHPLVRLLRYPNHWMTTFEFMAFVVTSHQLRGNAYVYVERDFAGHPSGLIPVSPDRMALSLAVDGRIIYQFSHPLVANGVMKTVSSSDMIHLRGMAVGDGIQGLSPITVASDAIGLAIAVQRHAALLFGQGTQMGGVLEHPGRLSPEASERIADSWQKAYSGGASAHRVALLEEGMKFNPITMSSLDSQLIEARQFSVIEIARLYRVPLHKIGDLSHATFSNIDAQSQDYLSDALMPITVRIEQAFEAALLFEDEIGKYSFRFDFNEMLRADQKTRFAAYQQGALTGFLNANEIRANEGLPPIPGEDGEKFRFPLNAAPDNATSVAKPTPNTPDEPEDDNKND